MSVEIHSKRIVKNTIFLYIRMLVVLLVGLFTSRVLLHYLGIEDFGLYNVVGSVVTSFAFLTSSLSAAGSRFITYALGEGDENRLKTTFSTTINIQIVLIALVVIVMLALGKWLLMAKMNIPLSRMDAVAFTLYIVVITSAIRLFSVPFSSAIIAYERMNVFAWFSIFDVLAKLGIAYGVASTSGDRLKAYSLMLLFVELAYAAGLVCYCHKAFLKLRYEICWDFPLVKRMFAFAGWQMITGIAIALGTQGYTILNQKYFGAELVAAFSIAMMVQGHLMAFISNFKTAANPQIIKSYAAGRYAESKKLLIDSGVFSVVIFLVLAVPVFAYADRILEIWLVEIPMWSAMFIRIVLVSAFFSIFDTTLYTALYATGYLKENVIANVAVGVLSFSISWWLIKFTHCPYIAVLSSAVSMVIIAVIVKPLILHKTMGYGLKDFYMLFIPAFKAAVPSCFIGYAFFVISPPGLVGLLVNGFMCAASVAVICWFGAFTTTQRAWAWGLLKNRLSFIKGMRK